MNSESLIPKDIYIKYTDKDGQTWNQHHRVWDAEKFVQSTQASYKKIDGKIEVITKQEFEAK